MRELSGTFFPVWPGSGCSPASSAAGPCMATGLRDQRERGVRGERHRPCRALSVPSPRPSQPSATPPGLRRTARQPCCAKRAARCERSRPGRRLLQRLQRVLEIQRALVAHGGGGVGRRPGHFSQRRLLRIGRLRGSGCAALGDDRVRRKLPRIASSGATRVALLRRWSGLLDRRQYRRRHARPALSPPGCRSH